MTNTTKPSPTKEIVVDRMFKLSRIAIIYTVTTDSNSWIESFAQEFGELSPTGEDPHIFRLKVYPNYDYDEVADYLEKGG